VKVLRSYPKVTKAENVAQVGECLPSKRRAVSSNRPGGGREREIMKNCTAGSFVVVKS
jgi:hypothetical protein